VDFLDSRRGRSSRGFVVFFFLSFLLCLNTTQ
jgi:hypothetical protein